MAEQTGEAGDSAAAAAGNSEAVERSGDAASMEDTASSGSAPEGGSGLRTNSFQPNAFGDQPTGVRYRSLFRDTGAPYTGIFRSNPIVEPMKAGNVEGSVMTMIPHFRVGSPSLRRGFEPSDATLKLGPIYIKIGSVSAGLIASDNINLTEENRESGVIAIVRSDIAVTVSLTEGFNFTMAGSVAWLPFQNTAGANGLAIAAPFMLSMDYVPLLQGQFSYDTIIAGWPVTFADDFHVSTGSWLQNSDGDFAAFEGFVYDDADRAGRYQFRDRTFAQPDQYTRDYDRDLNTNIVYLQNTISATTQDDLPSQIRFRAGIYHDNFVYFGGDDRTDDLPSRRDQIYLYAGCIRENTRFKPYASYRFIDVDTSDGSQHEFRTGITGPITDQMFIRLGGGAMYTTGNDRWYALADLTLHHTIGPLTSQWFSARRNYDDLNDMMYDQIMYNLNQVLGRNLTLDIFFSKTWYDQLGDHEQDYSYNYTAFRTGLRFTRMLSSKTHLRLSAIYAYNDWDTYDSNTYIGRAEVSHQISETMSTRIYYQYQQRDASQRGQSYYENAVFVNLTKYLQ